MGMNTAIDELNLIYTKNQQNNRIIDNYISKITATLELLPVGKLIEVINLLEETRMKGRRIFIFGNGGSAATASHFVCDLSKGANNDIQPRMKVFSLTDSIPLLTALANDKMYRNTFAEQIENLCEPDDVVIAISGSGNSWNVLKGLEIAKEIGTKSVGFVGFNGGKLKEMVDIAVIVQSDNIAQIEDIHLIMAHIITTSLREAK